MSATNINQDQNSQVSQAAASDERLEGVEDPTIAQSQQPTQNDNNKQITTTTDDQKSPSEQERLDEPIEEAVKEDHTMASNSLEDAGLDQNYVALSHKEKQENLASSPGKMDVDELSQPSEQQDDERGGQTSQQEEEKKEATKVGEPVLEDSGEKKLQPWESENPPVPVTHEIPNMKQFRVILNGWMDVSVNLGDITNEKVDAITNAANEYLSHGAGVAGAIMRRGGYEVQKLSDKWVDKNGIVETGQAAWTLPGKMTNCKYIIHAVGPVWSNGRKDDIGLLSSCVMNTLLWACKLNCESVSIPAISSGIFGFPKPLCAKTLFDTIESFVSQCGDPEKVPVKKVRFTNFDTETTTIFEKELVRRYLQQDKLTLSKTQSAPVQQQQSASTKKDGNPSDDGDKQEKKSLQKSILNFFGSK